MKFLFVWLSMLVVHALNAQQLINLNLTKLDSAIIYADVENRLQVTGLPANSTVQLEASFDYLQALSNHTFSIVCSKPRDIVIQVKVNGKLHFSKKMAIVKMLSFILPKLGKVKDTIATVTEILKAPYLVLTVKNSIYKCTRHVDKFDLVIKNTAGDILLPQQRTYDYKLSKEQIEMVRTLQSGDKLYFTSILIGCNGCRTMEAGLTITIE